MITEIFKCNECLIYTLKKVCPSCNSLTLSPKPAKYSPEDRFGYYRRKAKYVQN